MSEKTDLEAVDHAAEHHATTGSPACWCGDVREATDAEALAWAEGEGLEP